MCEIYVEISGCSRFSCVNVIKLAVWQRTFFALSGENVLIAAYKPADFFNSPSGKKSSRNSKSAAFHHKGEKTISGALNGETS